jgi:hypothetical protein
VSTEDSPSATTRATLPTPSLDRSASAPADLAPATIGSLVCDLAMIIGALEKHVGDMNYPDTDEFNAHTRDSLGGNAAGVHCAGPLPRVGQKVRKVWWSGRDHKRHPSMLGLLPA